MKNKHIKNMVVSAMFIAIGLILPFFTGQIQTIGNMLLPMHIPVFLAGLISGWQYGLLVGFILPLMRSVTLGMPVMYPNAIAMAFELATYGLVAGYCYSRAKWQCIKMLYRCMIIAMVAGRVVWGVVMMLLLSVDVTRGNAFTFGAFIAGAFTNAIPGIVLQLVVVPVIMVALNKAKMVPFVKKMPHKKVR